MLEDQEIVEKDKKEDWKNGTKRYCRLSKNTRLALTLKWPIKVKVGKKEFFFLLPEKQSEINQKVHLLLIMLTTIGFSVPEPVKVLSDVRPSDILINGKLHRFTPALPGICAKDMLHPYRDSTNGWRFRYIQFKDTLEVKSYFDKLRQFNPPIIRPINEAKWLKEEWLQRRLNWKNG